MSKINEVKKISAQELESKVKASEEIQLVDVREYPEFKAKHISGSILCPLSALKEKTSQIEKGQPVFLICKSGMRSQQAASELIAFGYDCTVLDGGIGSWEDKGLPVVEGETSVWAMDRQVRLTAGLMVAFGILFSWIVYPGFIFLSLFVGIGLIYSAITDTCGMALLLGKMPWNRK